MSQPSMFDKGALPVADWELHPERISEDGRRFRFAPKDYQGCSEVRYLESDGEYGPKRCVSKGFLQRSRRWTE